MTAPGLFFALPFALFAFACADLFRVALIRYFDTGAARHLAPAVLFAGSGLIFAALAAAVIL